MDAIASRFDPAADPDDGGGYGGQMALVAGERSYTWPRFRQTVYRTGNILRHHGVHDDSTVVVLRDAAPEAIFVLVGTWLLGGRIAFGPEAVVEGAVLVGPTRSLPAAKPDGAKSVIGYGNRPEDPTRSYFEGEMWSENPTFPPIDTTPERPIFPGDPPWTRGETIEVARGIVEEAGSISVVAIRDPIAVETAIAGVVAPVLAGATILLPTGEQTGAVAVTSGYAPEGDRVDPRTIRHPRRDE